VLVSFGGSWLFLVTLPGAKHGIRSRSKARKDAIFQHQSRHGQNLSVVVSQPLSYSCSYLRLRTGRTPRSRRGAKRSQRMDNRRSVPPGFAATNQTSCQAAMALLTTKATVSPGDLPRPHAETGGASVRQA
jgi:hypothetical protein